MHCRQLAAVAELSVSCVLTKPRAAEAVMQ